MLSSKVEIATATDASSLAPLIFESGRDNLTALFESAGTPRVVEYIKYALGFADGQFGYSHHHIIRDDNEVVACGSCWTNQVTDLFRQATLKSLLDFYGLQTTREILIRSEKLAELIPAPESDSLGLGHICVAASHRRSGLASYLLAYFAELAVGAKKSKLSLDVSVDNEIAIQFYLKFGFQEVVNKFDSLAEPEPLFKRHLHMQYIL